MLLQFVKRTDKADGFKIVLKRGSWRALSAGSAVVAVLPGFGKRHARATRLRASRDPADDTPTHGQVL